MSLGAQDFERTADEALFQVYLGWDYPRILATPQLSYTHLSDKTQTDLRSRCQPCQALAGTCGVEPSVGVLPKLCLTVGSLHLYAAGLSNTRGGFAVGQR